MNQTITQKLIIYLILQIGLNQLHPEKEDVYSYHLQWKQQKKINYSAYITQFGLMPIGFVLTIREVNGSILANIYAFKHR